MNVEEIKKIIPEDYEIHCRRDLGVFSSSIFGETYVKTFKDLLGDTFSSVLWVVKNRNFMTFYRSQKEHDKFREIVGKKSRNKEYAFALTKKLRELTDWINSFIKKNNHLDLFLAKKKKIVDNYRLFFAYHQIVYWAGDFLSEHNPELKEIIEELDKTYAYNERVAPGVESYLIRLGVNHLNYKETKGEFKDRGMFFFNNREQVDFFGSDLDELEDFIKKKKIIIEKDIKELKGIGVQKGKIKRKVKVITDLSKQGEIEEGIILVTGMTRPQFNNLLSKCKAIITNEGGMLCHASILAREFDIPCVVGTKVATNILKDNDLVELDGEKGIVRKIS